MAAVKGRSFATGALVVAGLAAAGVALLGKSPDTHVSGDAPAPEAIVSDAAPLPASPNLEADALAPDLSADAASDPAADAAIEKPIESQTYDRRRLAMSGSAKEIEAARKQDRKGSFRTILPPEQSGSDLPNAKLYPKLGLESGARAELGGDAESSKIAQGTGPGPMEFIVKLDDPRLVKELQREFAKSPELAARHMKSVMGNGKIVQRARLQGFTLGGEAILKFDGPRKINDFARVHDEIQRALSAAPGVSYAEQNYTADINSAQ